jgi:hypothetical protein
MTESKPKLELDNQKLIARYNQLLKIGGVGLRQRLTPYLHHGDTMANPDGSHPTDEDIAERVLTEELIHAPEMFLKEQVE